MVTRRQLLVAGGIGGGAALLLSPDRSWARSRRSAPSLDPGTIPKYVTELAIPAAMPRYGGGAEPGIDEYRIGLRQFLHQILPSGLPKTTVWGYGSVTDERTFSYPARTVNAVVDRPVRITWINQLVDGQGRFLPHLLPVDPTLHWANPPGGISGRDSMPTFTSTPGPYRGPVPMVVHLHGGHAAEESDGYPEAWYLPVARDIPQQFATVGSFYEEFRAKFESKSTSTWKPGTATFQYVNDERATTEWFHDHTLGMTRHNVYAGPIGFYLLRGGPSDLPPGVLPGPAPAIGDGTATRYHEIPLVIQDRSFYDDGELFYPTGRQFFDGYSGPYIPTTDVPPIWTPGFLASTIVVNGNTWPVLKVERRRYRLRFLNGCNSRFLILKIAANPTARPASAALPIWQIGSDGGFLASPVRLEQVLLGNAQRVDAIVDFTDVPEGTELYLINEGPDRPYAGGTTGTDFPPANVDTTGQVMKFVVGPRVGTDTSVAPDELHLPELTPLGEATKTRRLALGGHMGHMSHLSTGPNAFVPVMAPLGVVTDDGTAVALRWTDPITESPSAGSTEIWELHNRTMDAHPVHVHRVHFHVVGRGRDGTQSPAPSEAGYLDTVVALPGEITRIKVPFHQPGRFVWHCNNLEHEDNEMMRPYQVIPADAPDTGDGGPAGPNVALAATGVAVVSAAAIGAVLMKGRQSPWPENTD